jgi:hypothetical protein
MFSSHPPRRRKISAVSVKMGESTHDLLTANNLLIHVVQHLLMHLHMGIQVDDLLH